MVPSLLPLTRDRRDCPFSLGKACRVLIFGSEGYGDRPKLSRRFEVASSSVVGAALLWVTFYFNWLLPALRQHEDSPCEYKGDAKTLLAIFGWCAGARSVLLVPGIAEAVGRCQLRTRGRFWAYASHLLLCQGPHVTFFISSVLLLLHVVLIPCAKQSPELYSVLRLFSIISCLVSTSCFAVGIWHNRIVLSAATWSLGRTIVVDRQGVAQGLPAPPGTVALLETRQYSKDEFGKDEDRPFPAECAICLCTWEEDSVIKVTPCLHAFHEECIAGWLNKSRTCALCRQDVTAAAACDKGAQVAEGAELATGGQQDREDAEA